MDQKTHREFRPLKTPRQTVFRRISEIPALPTAHAVGLKKVLLANDETESAVTQIAVTTFNPGESAEPHVHSTMDEHYIFLEGDGVMTIGGKDYCCHADSYLLVQAGTVHTLRAVSRMKFITIGIAYD